MLKLLSHKTHALLDYVTVIAFALAPTMLGLTGVAAGVSYALAVAHLAVTLLTKGPCGVASVIPHKLHGVIELVVGLTLAVGPWLAADVLHRPGQIFLSAAGGVILLVWLLSDYGANLSSETTTRI